MSQPEHQGEAAVSLFEDLPAVQPEQAQAAQQTRKAAKRQGAARLLQPNRSQIELRASDLESLLGEDHLARLVWGYVERQDLSRLIEVIKARGSNAGRAAIDPRILFALWLYAVLSGVGSGREVARLTREHDAYRWICGGVSVNYHALNDFRSGNEALMDEVLTANVAALAAAGAISLERVAQDGMRVRADAGAASFRRAAALEQHLAEAGELVREVKQRAKDDPGASSRRSQAARQRAAEEREERIRAALEQLPQMQAAKRRNGDKPEHARASTTDADARVAPVPEPRAKTCKDAGKDAGKDGDEMPPPDKHQPKDGDSVAVAQWRARMAGQDIKEIYKQRAATAECVNALARNRGLQRLPVRGLVKVRAVAMLYALAHNLMRMAKIAPQLIGRGTGASAMAAAAT